MKKSWIREYFSIPNLMGYFRILLIPFFLYVYVNARTERDYNLAIIILAISCLTDLFDGKIARRFNMVTQFGKILDPIADKLTQGALALGFASHYPTMYIFLIAFIVKEIVMGLIGLYMIRKGHPTNGAQMHGKITTASIDISMLIILIGRNTPVWLVNILIAICLITMSISFIQYLIYYYHLWKDKVSCSK